MFRESSEPWDKKQQCNIIYTLDESLYSNRCVYALGVLTGSNEDLALKCQQYVEKVPRNRRCRLQYEIELDQHLRRLAKKMTEWEENYDLFYLDQHEVHDIKHGANKDRLALQR